MVVIILADMLGRMSATVASARIILMLIQDALGNHPITGRILPSTARMFARIAAMAECYNCGQPAQHEALVGAHARIWSTADPHWLPYCCACFDHDWREQRLLEGQECGKVLVTRQGLSTHKWQWRKEAD